MPLSYEDGAGVGSDADSHRKPIRGCSSASLARELCRGEIEEAEVEGRGSVMFAREKNLSGRYEKCEMASMASGMWVLPWGRCNLLQGI